MNVSIFIHYLLAINLLTFVAYGHDKWKAQNPDPKAAPRKMRSRKKRKKGRGKRVKNARRRTPEATLLLLAALGGSIGALLAMHIFRHKTLNKKFTIGVPAILVAQVLIIFIYYINVLKPLL